MKWIAIRSVGDLPKETGNYLTTNDDGGVGVHFFDLSRKSFDTVGYEAIDAWMPMPEPFTWEDARNASPTTALETVELDSNLNQQP